MSCFLPLRRMLQEINKFLLDGMPVKRHAEMDTHGFNGDTFSGGFGDFFPVKRNDAINHFARSSKRRFKFFPELNRFKV